jgi:drug/metabolite transporter (DMT)-like permease
LVKACLNNKLLLLLSLGFFWGSGYSIARYCVTHGTPSLGYSFWQSIGPAVLLCLILSLRTRSLAALLQLKLNHWRYFVLCGIFGIALPNTIMYLGAAHLPSSLVAVLVNTVPILIYPLALLSGQERFQYKRLLALIVGLIGILIIINHRGPLPAAHSIPWVLWVMLTPLCFASTALFINPLKPQNLEPLTAAAGMLALSSMVLLPFLLHHHAFYALRFNFLSALIVLEIILSSIGYLIFFRLIYLAGPVYYSLVGGVVAVTGILWGMLIFHESGSRIDCIGLFGIAVAIYTLNRKCITSPS